MREGAGRNQARAAILLEGAGLSKTCRVTTDAGLRNNHCAAPVTALLSLLCPAAAPPCRRHSTALHVVAGCRMRATFTRNVTDVTSEIRRRDAARMSCSLRPPKHVRTVSVENAGGFYIDWMSFQTRRLREGTQPPLNHFAVTHSFCQGCLSSPR
jgi:hypothetical protein